MFDVGMNVGSDIQTLTLQFPAMNAPRPATKPKTMAKLLSMELAAFLSNIWAWWKMQNTRTREEERQS